MAGVTSTYGYVVAKPRASVDYYGNENWFLNGELHREDGPAFKGVNGDEQWCIHGKLHREDGPAVIKNKYWAWFKYGKVHRVGGPAVYSAGAIGWYQNGKVHRIDGPAVMGLQGRSDEYWFNDLRINDPEIIKLMDGSEDNLVILKLKYGF